LVKEVEAIGLKYGAKLAKANTGLVSRERIKRSLKIRVYSVMDLTGEKRGPKAKLEVYC